MDVNVFVNIVLVFCSSIVRRDKVRINCGKFIILVFIVSFGSNKILYDRNIKMNFE